MEATTDTNRILVIDDSPLVRSWVELELFGAGFAVHTSESGAMGLQDLEWFKPDVVLCDMNMPGMSGLDVVRTLQRKNPLTPVVIYTDQQDVPVAVEALRQGACGYVLKGCDPGPLRRELDTALQYRHLRTRQLELEEANDQYQRNLEGMVRQKSDEIVQLQRMQARAEKMAALGTVVAGVAHEINNPLAVVLANLKWIAGSADDVDATEEEKQQAMTEAIQCAERIQRIVTDLRRVVHPGSTQARGESNVHEAIAEAMLVVREQAPASVQVDVSRLADAATASVRTDDLVTAVSNLVVNAAHAVEGNPAGRVWVTVEEELANVLVRVEDNGVGISPEHLARVTDPFFTTKSPGRGTGLGLALVDRIVRESGGNLSIQSALGVGTSITLSLPRAAH